MLSFITFDTVKKAPWVTGMSNIWDPVYTWKINMNSPERFPEPTSDWKKETEEISDKTTSVDFCRQPFIKALTFNHFTRRKLNM